MSWKQSNDDSCDGKKIYYSWDKAAQVEREHRSKGSSLIKKGKKLEKLRPYRCRSCNLFHLGHPPRKRLGAY